MNKTKNTSYKSYPKYKDSGLTWLGEMPSHWEIDPGLAAFSTKKEKNIGLRETTVLSLSYGRIVVKPPEKLHGLVPESFETYQIVNPGDIIIRSTDLQNDWNSLRVGLVEDRGIITSAYICLKTKDRMIPAYCHLLLHSYDLMKIFYGMGSGLRQNLDWSDFKRLPVLIPSLDEQKTIVFFIKMTSKKIARFIKSKRRLIEVLKEQKLVIINHAVTKGIDPNVKLKPSNVDYLGDIPEHWEIIPLRRVSKIIKTGGTPSGADEKYYSDKGFNWYTPGDFKDELVLSKSKRQLSDLGKEQVVIFPPNTVMTIGIGATIGKVAIAKDYSSCNQQINAIILNEKTIPEFVAYYLRCLRDYIIACGKYTTLPIINQQETKKLPIFLPPMKEQHEIIQFINDRCKGTDAAISRAERQIELIREYRIRLISDVVTGKIDVRDIPVGQVEGIEEIDELDEIQESEELTELQEVTDADD